MADDHHGVGPLGPGFGDRTLQGGDRIGRQRPAERLGRQPRRQAGRGQADEGDLEATDIVQLPGSNLFPGTAERAGRLAAPLEVGRQHGRCRSVEQALKGLGPPVKVMVAKRPGVIADGVEQIDHQPAIAGEADRSALDDVTDIDGQRGGHRPPPLADAAGTAGQATDILQPVVGFGRQDPAVQVCRMKQRDCLGPAGGERRRRQGRRSQANSDLSGGTGEKITAVDRHRSSPGWSEGHRSHTGKTAHFFGKFCPKPRQVTSGPPSQGG